MTKINRNSPCWCGSQKKYKKCHLKEDQLKNQSPTANKSITNPYETNLSDEFIRGMQNTCALAKQTLDMVESNIRIGMTTAEIDQLVHTFTLDHNAIPAPLNYKGFPKSVCTSINEVICHGIPDQTILKEGDIINVDVTCILDGYFGDTSRTFLVGECSDEAKKLVRVTRECLERAILILEPYLPIGNIGATIQKHARAQGFSVVEQYVGHGIGKEFHIAPQIPHFGKINTGNLLLPGMCFTIEPMINLGVKDAIILDDGWTAITADKKLSAQFEHTMMVTENSVDVLTV